MVVYGPILSKVGPQHAAQPEKHVLHAVGQLGTRQLGKGKEMFLLLLKVASDLCQLLGWRKSEESSGGTYGPRGGKDPDSMDATFIYPLWPQTIPKLLLSLL